MKAVILAGGYGTRISEESHLKPKPMIEIGGMPIIWHIMKIYSSYGINDFVICSGYKAEIIKNYFESFESESWNIKLVDTGLDTMTGGRIKRIENLIDDTFCLTYGDGVSNVNIKHLISFHKSNESVATLTAIHPPERFGVLDISGKYVTEFHEKHRGESSWINGGFFVFDRKMLSYLTVDENCDFEFGPLQQIAKEGQLKAFRHDGFWQCMDNVRERDYLDKIVKDNAAPWLY